MIIELSKIYNNRPYYTIKSKDGTIAHAFGYDQVRPFVEKAKAAGEEIKVVDTRFLEEHSQLVALLTA